jgi:hypothetical protein
MFELLAVLSILKNLQKMTYHRFCIHLVYERKQIYVQNEGYYSTNMFLIKEWHTLFRIPSS